MNKEKYREDIYNKLRYTKVLLIDDKMDVEKVNDIINQTLDWMDYIALDENCFELKYCEKCMQMTNHKLVCQKCKSGKHSKA